MYDTDIGYGPFWRALFQRIYIFYEEWVQKPLRNIHMPLAAFGLALSLVKIIEYKHLKAFFEIEKAW